jgi:hypothetical protein
MTDVIQALNRQAEWQRARGRLSWAEKLRQAVAMRESLRGFARTAPAVSGTPEPGIEKGGSAAGGRVGKLSE